jgi:hypothetical protein
MTTQPQPRIEALITLTERLTGAIAAQATAFEAHRPQDAAGQMGEVARMANVYRRESADLRETPGLVQGAPLEQRRRLRRAIEAFDAVLARHARALGAAKTVTEGLVRAIAEEVAGNRLSGSGYGPRANAKPASATAITLNRSA